MLRGMIAAGKAVDRGKDLYPAFQGMQDIENMVSGDGKLDPLDDERYGPRDWIDLSATLAAGKPDFIWRTGRGPTGPSVPGGARPAVDRIGTFAAMDTSNRPTHAGRAFGGGV